jgi:hypothetical protein
MAPPTKKNMIMKDLLVNSFLMLGKYLHGKRSNRGQRGKSNELRRNFEPTQETLSLGGNFEPTQEPLNLGGIFEPRQKL